jgi:hypothetical protein
MANPPSQYSGREGPDDERDATTLEPATEAEYRYDAIGLADSSENIPSPGH